MRKLACAMIIAAAMMIPAQALALGEIRLGADILIKPGSELDPVTDKGYLAGATLGIDFEFLPIWQGGLTLDLAIGGVSIDGTLYDRYPMDLQTFSIDAGFGYRLWVTDWMTVWLRATVGPDHVVLTLGDRPWYDQTSDSSEDAQWNWHVAAVAAVTFYLPQALIESWKPWDDFNFGIGVEGGYVYRPEFTFDLLPARGNPDSGSLSRKNTTLGDLDLSGPIVRVMVTWAF